MRRTAIVRLVLACLLTCPAAAQDAVISEFMAKNATTLADEDGDYSDWIEVRNATGAPLDLGGWFLTDDAGDLVKWAFPSTVVPVGGHVLVFASGKNRFVSGSELHTNFQLSSAGEFLALIEPNGLTIASSFAPQFPPQRTDVSYGTGAETEVLVAADGPRTAVVPIDGSFGTLWREQKPGAGAPGAAAHWALDEVAGTVASDSSGNGNDGALVGYAFPLWGPGGVHAGALGLDGIDDHVAATMVGVYASGQSQTVCVWVNGNTQADRRVYGEASSTNGNPEFSIGTGDAGAAGQGGAAVRVVIRDDSGAVILDQHSDAAVFDGAWHHIAFVDDGGTATLYVDGVADAASFDYTPGGAVTTDRVALGALLQSAASAMFGGAIDDVRTYPRALGPSEILEAMHDAAPPGTAWIPGTSGVGYEDDTGFESLIGLDMLAPMLGNNETVFIRVPFIVDDPSQVTSLQLRLQYDDGFVAYLNGSFIDAENEPAILDWSSGATQVNADSQAVIFENFDMTPLIGALTPGLNVLAIHGLNKGASSSDALFRPEVVAGTSTILAYFDVPTPGNANGAGLAGLVEDPTVDVARGFYDTPFAVTITNSTPGATVMYTTDGSEPTLTNGIPYTGPVMITTTTVLRAAAFLTGWVPSLAVTNTYIFVADVVQQTNSPAGFPSTWSGAPAADYEMDTEITQNPAYAPYMEQALTDIPTLSLVTDSDNLFGPSGIYVNPQQSGVAWERPCSAELIHPDGTPGFQIDCGLRIQGGASRDPLKSPKHSFRLLFKSQYGPTKLDYPLFSESSAVDEFDTIVLRAGFNNSWIHWNGPERERGQYIRDQWMKATQRAMGHDSPHNNYAHLYVNGVYWGIFNPTERPSAPFAASYGGGVKEDYDALNAGEAIDGDTVAWDTMMAMANAGLTLAGDYAAIQQYVDPVNLADYMVMNLWAGNTDWDHHNWYAARKREPGAQFRFYSWDAERIFDFLTYDNTNEDNDGNPSRVFQRLRDNDEFDILLADRIHRHMFNGGALTEAAGVARWMSLRQIVEVPVIAESARWGDYRRDVHVHAHGPYDLYEPDVHWDLEDDEILNTHFPQRPGIVLSQFQTAGMYPNVEAPAFNQHGGPVPLGFQLTMTAPSGTIHYTTDGSDPRQVGGAVSASAVAYAGPVTLNASGPIKARVLDGTTWSALNEATFVVDSVVINEFLAKNDFGLVDEAGETDDWIEIANPTGVPIDVGGYWLTDDLAEPMKWQIPSPSVIAPGGTLLIWADEDLTQGTHHASFKLSASGEAVGLFLADGTLQDSVTFGPQLADVSTGRLFDGGAQLVTFPDPTPDAPNQDPCGLRRYSGLDPTAYTIGYEVLGNLAIGGAISMEIRNGPPYAYHFVLVSPTPGLTPAPTTSVELLLGTSPDVLLALPSDLAGELNLFFNVYTNPALVGFTTYLQVAAFDISANLHLSNAVEARICP